MSEFEAIASVGTLREYLKPFSTIVDEVTLHFRDDALYGQPVDPASVATVNQWLRPAAFESYHADGFRMGVNLQRFDDYLSKGDSDALANLSLDAETRRIDIDLPNTSFSMAGIDPDSVRNGQSIAEMSANDPERFIVDVELDGAALSHGIDVVGMVTDHVTIDADPDRDNPIHFIGEGDTDDASVEYGESLHEGSAVDEAAVSLYSEDYLADMTNPIPKDAAVRLQTGEEWPLRLDYSYADGNADVQMLCAPRIQKR